jgi:MOSC domain-containing protein YiiM
MKEPILLSIQVGLPRSLGVEAAPEPMDRPWRSGFYKDPVAGPVWLGRTNLAGDGQADLVNHGGPDKAVLAYAADHYPDWRAELSLPDLPFGAFGENFTVAGLTEADVCIGDRWALGDARLEVSQPRLPCWKLARRWRIKDLSSRVERTGRSGWYLRVLTEGHVAPRDVWRLETRPHPEWTVSRASRLRQHDRDNLADMAVLMAVPALAATWQAAFARRLQRVPPSDDSRRLIGPNEG